MDNLAILAYYAILSLLHFKFVLNNSSSALVTWSQTRTSFLHNLHLKVCITLLSRKNHKFRPQLSPCLTRNRCRGVSEASETVYCRPRPPLPPVILAIRQTSQEIGAERKERAMSEIWRGEKTYVSRVIKSWLPPPTVRSVGRNRQ